MYTRQFSHSNGPDDPEIIPMDVFAANDPTDTTPYGFANSTEVLAWLVGHRRNAPGFIEYAYLELGPHKVTTEGRWESEQDWLAAAQLSFENANWVTAYTALCNRYRTAYNITQVPAPGSDPYVP